MQWKEKSKNKFLLWISIVLSVSFLCCFLQVPALDIQTVLSGDSISTESVYRNKETTPVLVEIQLENRITGEMWSRSSNNHLRISFRQGNVRKGFFPSIFILFMLAILCSFIYEKSEKTRRWRMFWQSKILHYIQQKDGKKQMKSFYVNEGSLKCEEKLNIEKRTFHEK